MAVVWMDGFDHYSDDGPAGSMNFGKGSAGGLTTGRFGGKCLSILTTHESFYMKVLDVSAPTQNEMTFGFACRVTGDLGSGDIALVGEKIDFTDLYGLGVDTAQNHLRIYASGQSLRLQGTGITTTAYHEFPYNVWFYLEVTLNFTTNEAKLILNENVLETTAYAPAAPIQPYWWSISAAANNASANARLMDDMYISNSATPLGDCRVETHFPDADGTYEEWATSDASADSFSVVDDGTASTWENDWIQSDTAGQRSTFTSAAAFAATPQTIHGVSIFAVAEQSNAGSRTWSLMAKDGVTEVNSTPTSGYVPYKAERYTMAVRPDTSGPWDVASVTALEFGVKLES